MRRREFHCKRLVSWHDRCFPSRWQAGLVVPFGFKPGSQCEAGQVRGDAEEEGANQRHLPGRRFNAEPLRAKVKFRISGNFPLLTPCARKAVVGRFAESDPM